MHPQQQQPSSAFSAAPRKREQRQQEPQVGGGDEEALSVRRLTQRFASSEIERAFRRHVGTRLATRPRIALYRHATALPCPNAPGTAVDGVARAGWPLRVCRLTAVNIAALVAFILISVLDTKDRQCSHRSFTSFASACAAAVAVFLAVGLKLGGIPFYSQEALTLACCWLLAGTTLHAGVVCDDLRAFVGGPRRLPPIFYPLVSTWYVATIYLIFGSTVWPASLACFVASVAPHVGVFLYFDHAVDSTYRWCFILVLIGCLASALFAALLSWERRKDFAASLALEKERRQMFLEKYANESLIANLFPKAPALPQAARAYASAACVYMRLDGVEAFASHEEQLRVLSALFVAADSVASCCSAEKLQVCGRSLLFVCGVPTESKDNDRNACRLALGLQEMAAYFRGQGGLFRGLSLRVGVSIGPVVAAVIGRRRPRYDVWGYTVSVCKKLARSCPPGGILVTKDVVCNLRTSFSFELLKELAYVRGVGRIMMFRLSPGEQRLSVDFNTSLCARSFTIRRRQEVSLYDVARGQIPVFAGDFNALTLTFPDWKTELEFLSSYTRQYIAHTRVLTLCAAAVFSLYLVWTAAARVQQTTYAVAVRAAHIGLCVAMALATLLRVERRCIVAYQALMYALAVAASCLVVVMWDTRVWRDAMLCGMATWFAMLHTARLPFFLVAPLTLLIVLATLPMFILMSYPSGSIAWEVLAGLSWVFVHRSSEALNRQLFFTSRLVMQSKAEYEAEKDAGTALITTLLPEPVLARLAGSDEEVDFLAEMIPSGTILICAVAQFEGVFQAVDEVGVVALLNSLFSSLDSLADSLQLAPLKTIGESYFVVGNMLNDTPDHAVRVAELAQAMLQMMPSWNSECNPTGVPIHIQVAVHTDSILTGVIKMKSTQFDCWGRGMQVCERLCRVCPADFALVSAATAAAVPAGRKLAAEPYRRVDVGGAVVETVLLHRPVEAYRGRASEEDRTAENLSYVPVGGIDYGVVGTGTDDRPACGYAVPSAMMQVEMLCANPNDNGIFNACDRRAAAAVPAVVAPPLRMGTLQRLPCQQQNLSPQ
eukprot:m51a1_g7349 putative family 3 adenylate cyclase (1058) ;mRNA; r:934-5576